MKITIRSVNCLSIRMLLWTLFCGSRRAWIRLDGFVKSCLYYIIILSLDEGKSYCQNWFCTNLLMKAIWCPGTQLDSIINCNMKANKSEIGQLSHRLKYNFFFLLKTVLYISINMRGEITENLWRVENI